MFADYQEAPGELKLTVDWSPATTGRTWSGQAASTSKLGARMPTCHLDQDPAPNPQEIHAAGSCETGH